MNGELSGAWRRLERLSSPAPWRLPKPAPRRSQPDAATAARFEQTIIPHLDAAHNLARYLSRDADAAQDIVQEAFLRAFRSFGDFRGGSPRAWISRSSATAIMIGGRNGSVRRWRRTTSVGRPATTMPRVKSTRSTWMIPRGTKILLKRTFCGAGSRKRFRRSLNRCPNFSGRSWSSGNWKTCPTVRSPMSRAPPIGTVMSRLAVPAACSKRSGSAES